MKRHLVAVVGASILVSGVAGAQDWCVMPDNAIAGLHVPNLWTDGVVPFAFHGAVVEEDRERAFEAMCSIEHVCGVRFVAYQGQSNWVYIGNSDEDYSYSTGVGMVGGRQDVDIHQWESHFLIVHELMHALGVKHEQQRPDRDQYIEVFEERIEKGKEGNFAIFDGHWVGPYDFDSVMHYNACAFSTCVNCQPDIDGCVTIKVKPPFQAWQDEIGQLDNLSDGDRQLLAHLYPTPDDGWAWTATMFASDDAPKQYFGFGIAADGGRTVVGAPGQDYYQQNDPDRAYVYSSSGAEIAKFYESGWDGDSFGRSVAIEGDRVVVGSPPHGWVFTGDYGHVWGYDLGNPQTVFLIELPDLEAYKGFGHAVDIADGKLAIASPLYNPFDFIPSIDFGAAYLYDVETLSKLATMRPSDAPDEYINFGADVATDGNVVLVSALSGHKGAMQSTGAVYVYSAGGTEMFKLTASDAESYDGFGAAVAVENGIAVIGSAQDTHNGVYKCGSAYVFNATTGQQIMKLVPSDSGINQAFGRSVSISDGKVIIGAPGDSEQSLAAGAAYVFDLSTGEELDKFMKPCGVGGSGDYFGWSVGADGDTFSVGALHENDSTGLAYRFEMVEAACPADFNNDGSVSILDFIMFRSAWMQHKPAADCNGDLVFDILDFMCFRALINAGCD